MNRLGGLGLLVALTSALALGAAGCAISLTPAGAGGGDGGTPPADAVGSDGGFVLEGGRDAMPNPDVIGCALPTGGVCPANSGCWSPDHCSVCFCSASLVLTCDTNVCTDGGPPPVDVPPPPPDGGPRRCFDGSQCAPSDSCVFDAPGCGIPGICRPMLDCGMDPQPYCACDGNTYFTQCEGHTHAWTQNGPCPATPCRSAFDCTGGNVCVFPQGCNGAPGQCVPPLECPMIQAFCSCSGQTYFDCGPTQPYAFAGTCGDTDGGGPVRCDLASNLGCPSEQECVPDPGCTTQGTCMDIALCSQDVAPFCDCNGDTFLSSSNCPFQMYAHAGACATREGMPCSAFSDVDCGPRLLCVMNGPDCMGNGICTRAANCRFDTAPFCGCDGNTQFESSNCPTTPYVHTGACEQPDAGPGRPCTSIRDCVSGEACVFPQGCNAPVGNCQQIPPCDFPQPFCACDGSTYSACSPVRPFSHAGVCEGIPDAAVDAAVDAALDGAFSSDGGIVGACNGAQIGVDGLCYGVNGAPFPLSCCRGYLCDESQAFCDRLPPTCSAGEVPEIVNNCYGPCVLFANCATIRCDPANPNGTCPQGTRCDPSRGVCAQ